MPIPAECPGSKFVTQPVPIELDCPKCGEELELWSDELFTNCPECNTTINNSGEAENSCINWCEFAEKCVGTETYNKFKQVSKD